MTAPAGLIRKARKDAGLTQASLAAQLGVTVGTVTRWESGAVDPPSSQLARAVAMCGLCLAIKPRTGAPPGCSHALQSIDRTCDVRCADCGAVTRRRADE